VILVSITEILGSRGELSYTLVNAKWQPMSGNKYLFCKERVTWSLRLLVMGIFPYFGYLYLFDISNTNNNNGIDYCLIHCLLLFVYGDWYDCRQDDTCACLRGCLSKTRQLISRRKLKYLDISPINYTLYRYNCKPLRIFDYTALLKF
jgi:hypothetical protein